MTQTPHAFMNAKINDLKPFLKQNELDDIKWLNIIAAVDMETKKEDAQIKPIDMLGYHYITLVDLYKKIDELNTNVTNLAALIAES